MDAKHRTEKGREMSRKALAITFALGAQLTALLRAKLIRTVRKRDVFSLVKLTLLIINQTLLIGASKVKIREIVK
jgi:hypothetical protein